jgi:hypothetical protein
MSKELTAREFAEQLLTEIDNAKQAKIKVDWEPFAAVIRAAATQPDIFGPVPAAVPIPPTPPEFPKLKVRYEPNHAAYEWLVVNSWSEEEPYHSGGWYTRPMKEMEMLKAAGIPERAKEEWQRRKGGS